MTTGLIILGIVVLIILFLIFTNVLIVPQSHEFIIEVLGKYHRTWGAGIHVKPPFLGRVVKRVDLKEQVLDTPPQNVITKDNVTMKIDAVVYYHVFDARLYTYGASDPILALGNLSATTLRNVVGSLSLDEALTSRDTINAQLTATLDSATDPWGIKVTRVEVKNIIPPDEIRVAMEKEMKAERDRRQTVLEAEGHKQAVITRAEGDKQAMLLAAEGEKIAEITRAEGSAKARLLAKQAEAEGLKLLKDVMSEAGVLELRKYDAMTEVANGTAAKLIIPTDVVEPVKRNAVFTETTGLGETTRPTVKAVKTNRFDPCCEDKQKHYPKDTDLQNK